MEKYLPTFIRRDRKPLTTPFLERASLTKTTARQILLLTVYRQLNPGAGKAMSAMPARRTLRFTRGSLRAVNE